MASKSPGIEVTYGARSSEDTYTLKKHMDVFLDNKGIGKLVEIVPSEGMLPINLENGEHVMAPLNEIRPLTTIQPYEVDRLLSIISNRARMAELGLGNLAKVTPSKKKRSQRQPVPMQATERVLRRRKVCFQGTGDSSMAGTGAAGASSMAGTGAAGAEDVYDDNSMVGDGMAGAEGATEDSMAGDGAARAEDADGAARAEDADGAACPVDDDDDSMAGDGAAGAHGNAAAGAEGADDDSIAGDSAAGVPAPDKGFEARVVNALEKLSEAVERLTKKVETQEKKLKAGDADSPKKKAHVGLKFTKEEQRAMGSGMGLEFLRLQLR